MIRPFRIFLFILCAIMIAAAGMGAGYVLKQRGVITDKTIVSDDASSIKTADTESATNETVYEVSPPSRGAAITKLPLDITPDNNKARVTIPASQASDVKAGQYALLYAKDGQLLEILGQVTDVSEPHDDKVIIDMDLNGDSAISSDDAVRADIILTSTTEAQRLPLSSISQGQDGKSYVWEVNGTDNTSYKARRMPANILSRTYDFVVVEQQGSRSNVFILNPDANLRDGQEIKIRKMLFSAPFKTEETIVSDAIAYRQPRELGKDPYEGKARQGCGYTNDSSGTQAGGGCGQAGGSAACGGGSSACGSGQNDVVLEFIQKIRANASKPVTP